MYRQPNAQAANSDDGLDQFDIAGSILSISGRVASIGAYSLSNQPLAAGKRTHFLREPVQNDGGGFGRIAQRDVAIRDLLNAPGFARQ